MCASGSDGVGGGGGDRIETESWQNRGLLVTKCFLPSAAISPLNSKCEFTLCSALHPSCIQGKHEEPSERREGGEKREEVKLEERGEREDSKKCKQRVAAAAAAAAAEDEEEAGEEADKTGSGEERRKKREEREREAVTEAEAGRNRLFFRIARPFNGFCLLLSSGERRERDAAVAAPDSRRGCCCCCCDISLHCSSHTYQPIYCSAVVSAHITTACSCCQSSARLCALAAASPFLHPLSLSPFLVTHDGESEGESEKR